MTDYSGIYVYARGEACNFSQWELKLYHRGVPVLIWEGPRKFLELSRILIKFLFSNQECIILTLFENYDKMILDEVFLIFSLYRFIKNIYYIF